MSILKEIGFRARGNGLKRIASLLLAFLLPVLSAGIGLAEESRVKELAKLSIEELISMKVTSVLKTRQPLSQSPAAIHVITQADIQRSGARNLPDLLRTVPGVQVAEVDYNIFAISIRGFNDIHANKLLVMVDGRTVYNHIFSGVIWSFMDVFLEDIERIEIIRGPGSSVWGANAVNGVINIITKKASDTQGAFTEFGSGEPDSIQSGIRYGGHLGENAAYRIYAKGREMREDHLNAGGFDTDTDANSWLAGFRTDWLFRNTDELMFQGEAVGGRSHSEGREPIPNSRRIDHGNRHLYGRWRHIFSSSSETSLQIYYQQEERVGDYRYDMIDLDFQHNYQWTDRHQLVWGFGYRFITDELIRGLMANYSYDPMGRDLELYSVFAQDTFQMLPDILSLTVGTKIEHNDFTGFEVQPGIRGTWTPHEVHTFWAAVSRAVRTPSRVDADAATQPHEAPIGEGLPILSGNENFDSEDLTAYEIGYRTVLMDNLFLDIAAFFNVYDHLASYENIEPGVWTLNNEMEGETYGLEVSVDYRLFQWWRLSGAWSFLEMDVRLRDEQGADLTGYLENADPRHQFFLHSALDIGQNIHLDAWLRHVEGIAHMRPSFVLFPPEKKIDDYTTFDLRLAWRPMENTELSVTGQNLGGDHPEFTGFEVNKRVYFNVEITFGE